MYNFVVQPLNHVQLFATPWTAVCQASLSFTISLSLLRFMPIELVMLSNHLILATPFSSAFNLSQHQSLFPWVSSSNQRSIGVSASASVLPMNIQDWFLLGFTALISLQSEGLSRIFSKHHSSKASILQCSAFYLCFCKHLLMFFYFLLIPEFIIICPRPKLFFQLVCVI